mmetsp:Transcript_4058/g.6696  ORF Transcript_4058/g.6696 Transcript_4058/m.6696 type:complete len:235 (+) Transcript_4058:682-1386(+)
MSEKVIRIEFLAVLPSRDARAVLRTLVEGSQARLHLRVGSGALIPRREELQQSGRWRFGCFVVTVASRGTRLVRAAQSNIPSDIPGSRSLVGVAPQCIAIGSGVGQSRRRGNGFHIDGTNVRRLAIVVPVSVDGPLPTLLQRRRVRLRRIIVQLPVVLIATLGSPAQETAEEGLAGFYDGRLHVILVVVVVTIFRHGRQRMAIRRPVGGSRHAPKIGSNDRLHAIVAIVDARIV